MCFAGSLTERTMVPLLQMMGAEFQRGLKLCQVVVRLGLKPDPQTTESLSWARHFPAHMVYEITKT